MSMTFDTSRSVTIQSGPYAGEWTWERVGRESSLLTQGYVEALFASAHAALIPTRDDPDLRKQHERRSYVRKVAVQLESRRLSTRRPVWRRGRWCVRDENSWMTLARDRRLSDRWTYRSTYSLAFRRLAPEALARIMGDCEAERARVTAIHGDRPEDATEHAGRIYWQARQAGAYGPNAVLTFHFDNDGKVCLRGGRQ
jgi:hypothetical protein